MTTGPTDRPRRPRAAVSLAWLQIIQGLATLLIGLAFTLQGGAALGDLPAPIPFLTITDPLGSFERGALQLLLAFPIIWVGFGLFRLKSWAWLAAMTLQGVVLFVNLASYFRGRANYVSMIMSVIIVFYLNSAEAREAFEAGPARSLRAENEEAQ